MAKAAIIVESPTKTRTIERFVGKEFVLLASMGHVRDLPARDLGVDVENDFDPTYVTTARQKKVLSELRKKLKGIDEVYLASDPDREGEAIAWHLAEELKLKAPKRIEFNEITEPAVRQALDSPREIDLRRVDSQQARRVLDRLVGYELSPLLWRRIKGQKRGISLSAGRVQSVALRLLCDREREIDAFEAVEYWSIDVDLTPEDRETPFTATLATKDGEKLELKAEQEAAPAAEELRGLPYRVSKITKREQRRRPKAPFTTSTMQQAAARALRFSAHQTMTLADQLYQGVDLAEGTVSLITYMRTDSTRVSQQAQEEARRFVNDRYGERFVGAAPKPKKQKAGVQDAHEAIRPSYLERTPEELEPHLTTQQLALYRLIWQRFLASQMAPAIVDVTRVDIEAGAYGLRASGSVIKFAGHLAVYQEETEDNGNGAQDEQDKRLPELREGEPLRCLQVRPEQHFTKPPPRYSEATLVQALEEHGIGRPSTYASILHTLRQRKYVRMQQRRFIPTPLGFVVCDYLVDNFPHILDVQFTASLEKQLDAIQDGEQDWVELLRHFYEMFHVTVEAAGEAGPKELDEECPECGGTLVERLSPYGKFIGCRNYPECEYSRPADDVPASVRPTTEKLDEKCPECEETLVVREGRRGKFVGCSGYPKCNYVRALDNEGKPKEAPVVTEHVCEKCGKPLVVRDGRRGKFYGCSGYPECRNLKEIGPDGAPVAAASSGGGSVETGVTCEDCGKPMVVRRGKRGAFLGCSGYPKCRSTGPIPPELREKLGSSQPQPTVTDEKCEECGANLVLRDSKRGRFLGCSNFPKCRYTRDYSEGDGDGENAP